MRVVVDGRQTISSFVILHCFRRIIPLLWLSKTKNKVAQRTATEDIHVRVLDLLRVQLFVANSEEATMATESL